MNVSTTDCFGAQSHSETSTITKEAKKKQGTMADNPVKSYSEKLSQAITPKAPTTIPESAPRNVNRFQIKESKITGAKVAPKPAQA